jgi:hypothetical protein
MRTTVNVDDDVLDAARSIARSEGRGIGAVISELARRGLTPTTVRVSVEDGFPVFSIPDDAPPITDAMVRAALDED